MPIYEYYCPDNHRIYQFFAKTLAQGSVLPRCPDNPRYKMQKVVSRFAVNVGGKSDAPEPAASAGATDAEDQRMAAAMDQVEREFSTIDENDSKAMGKMMRRMAELSGEKIEGQVEEMVRKLEEGADPEALEEQMGGDPTGGDGDDPEGMGGPDSSDAATSAAKKEARARYKARRLPPTRDPKLYDYE